MPDEADTSQKGKSGVLASVRASVGALSLSGEPGQRKKTWKLWKNRFVELLDGWQSMIPTSST